jgi:hypothetical protein
MTATGASGGPRAFIPPSAFRVPHWAGKGA